MCRFYSDDASSNNGGYRSAAFVIELRGGNAGFLLPAEQVTLYMYSIHVTINILLGERE